MRFTSPLGCVLTGSAALVLFAGCSGDRSSVSPASFLSGAGQSQSAQRWPSSLASPHSWSVLPPGVNFASKPDLSVGFADPDAALKAAVIVSDIGTETVHVYTTSGQVTAEITGLNEPQGLAAGAFNDLYIANTRSQEILVYRDDYKTLKSALNDPGQLPAGVDINPVTGVVGVTNIISSTNGPGSVSFYEAGTTMPCKTVADGTWRSMFFGAFDRAGNFYITGDDANFPPRALVGVVSGGCSARAITTLTTTNTIIFPGAVRVTPSGKIAIEDQIGRAIYTYNAPSKGSLGSPVATTALLGSGQPVSFAFSASGTAVWTTDAILGESREYTYPAGGWPQYTFTGLTVPIDVLVRPSVHP